MSKALETPVIVGVGQILQHLEDARQAAEPLDMMVAPLAQAAEDTGGEAELAARREQLGQQAVLLRPG